METKAVYAAADSSLRRTFYGAVSLNIEPRGKFPYLRLSWELKIEAVNGHYIFSLAYPSAHFECNSL